MKRLPIPSRPRVPAGSTGLAGSAPPWTPGAITTAGKVDRVALTMRSPEALTWTSSALTRRHPAAVTQLGKLATLGHGGPGRGLRGPGRGRSGPVHRRHPQPPVAERPCGGGEPDVGRTSGRDRVVRRPSATTVTRRPFRGEEGLRRHREAPAPRGDGPAGGREARGGRPVSCPQGAAPRETSPGPLRPRRSGQEPARTWRGAFVAGPGRARRGTRRRSPTRPRS